jgi:hypothetical protein
MIDQMIFAANDVGKAWRIRRGLGSLRIMATRLFWRFVFDPIMGCRNIGNA